MKSRRIHTAMCLALVFCLTVGCDQEASKTPAAQDTITEPRPRANDDRGDTRAEPKKNRAQQTDTPSPPTVTAAREQIGKTIIYDGAYVGLSYPDGDVPIERGVCTDVVIRALRDARDMDLQQLVHEDMKANFAAYPTIWGLSRPDKNIDHRRVPNLQTYFKRHGYQLETSGEAGDFEPGDLVTCTVGGNRPHIMIVSNKTSPSGLPLVIHNIGRGTVEEDRLLHFPITGHYRINKP